MKHQLASRRALAACAAAAAVVAGASTSAHAGLFVDVRALPGTGYTVGPGGKGFTLTSGGSVTVTFGVYGRVSGTNATQNSGDWDGQADAPDKHNDDSIDIVVGSFKSVGGLLGSLSANPAGQDIGYNSRVIPFNNNGSTNGIAADFDSDGDLDIGTNGSDVSRMWAVRVGVQGYATEFDGNPANKGWSRDDAGVFGLNAEDVIIDPTTSELRMGTLRFVTSGGGGGASASINFVPPPAGGALNSNLWFEDGLATGKMPSTAVFGVGAPVIGVPEPVSAALLAGVASLGLLARRRRG